MPSEEHGEPLLICPGGCFLMGTRPWLVGTILIWHVSRVNSWLVPGLCLNPGTCTPLGRWDLAMEYVW